jgi:hypothetical protein
VCEPTSMTQTCMRTILSTASVGVGKPPVEKW